MAAEAPAVAPAASLDLDACIKLGLEYQPSLAAAQASLAAAQSGSAGVHRIPQFLSKDLRIRRQQACQGVTIAEAGLQNAEWDTRYAVTRNFFTIQYVLLQREVIEDVIRSLTSAQKKAKKLFDSGTPDVKITKIDLDALEIQMALVKDKKAQIENGLLKAKAALREAMGVRPDYELNLVKTELPPAVYEVKVMVDEKDANGKSMKKEKIEYHRLYSINKEELISSAVANRGEMVQANAAYRVTELETDAQRLTFKLKMNTFAYGSDIHVMPLPSGIFNGEYRPGAIGLEMPSLLVGSKKYRVQRASDLSQRAAAVVDKTTNLVSLDVEAQFLKWQEAVEDVQSLSGVQKIAKDLPGYVLGRNPAEFTGAAVIQSNTTAIMVRTELNDARHMHALALAGLERATAGAFRVYPIPAAPSKK